MGKPRVIISSDIGGSDPDDMESMAHVLLYADKLDIKALISTPTKNAGRAADIHKALDAYTLDYNNLKSWGDYPAPTALKSVVYQGNINVPGPSGYSTATPASQAIIKAAHEGSAADPLYVLAWGAMTDIAQALHDDPSIAGKIRILSSNGWNSTQDPYSREYVYNNFKDVWWVESKSTHRGIYVNASGVEGNSFNMNEAKGHGALGDYFYNARPWGVKMGDSWSVAYLIDQINNANPGDDSWGGTFVQNGHGPNFWTDDTNPLYKLGTYNGAAYVREHQNTIYSDFYKQLDKAKAPNPAGGVDDPVVAKNDAATTQKDKAVVVNVLLNDGAADGGLKLAGADAASAQGGKVVVNADGTVTYTPKTGFTGTDSFKYTAKDVDGDVATATVTVNVQPPSSGSGYPVDAKDDAYSVNAGTKLYFNTKYILMNDWGPDGGLKATIGSTSANGVALEKWADGTIVYKAGTVNGTDRIDYVLSDVNGSTDTGSVIVTIKNGVASVAPTEPTAPTSPTAPSSGTVLARDDTYKIDAGKTLYFNTKYVTYNDSGSGALNVVSVDAVSERGVAVSWAADGTTIYRAQAGFEGTDKINYKVADQAGGYDIGTVLINVNDPFQI
jgi:hypothetical protein